MPVDVLDNFHAPVAAWFRDVFIQPTAVQEQAWKAISRGDNTLVVAPTGSGKTLAAFLWSLSKLTSNETQGTKVLYISPLKALGVDVDRNLAAPLAGIARTAEALGEPIPEIRVGVRSGDTPASERAKLLRKPPEILITTPESLYLMLTSKAAGTLVGVDTVIVDEVHAVAGTKRGTHLALSLERLEMITEQPVQRIGLSATVNPIDTVASFLAGDRPITTVNPEMKKLWDVRVRSVVDDFQDPPQEAQEEQESALPQQKSVWPFVQQAIYEQVMENHSTLVFVNSRRAAERLTGALNERWAEEHDPDSLAAPTRRDPAQLMAQSTQVIGSPAIIARAHHGSVSKDERADIEQALKNGELKCVVATSSLELGIDMGLVDHVIQVGAPPSVASAVQRCGRSGHTVGAVSAATIYPLHKQDAEVATVIVDRMFKGELEPLKVVKNALDVLSQQTVAAAARGTLDVEQWWATVRRSYPYAALHRDAFDGVIALISGYYPSTDFSDLKPRVVYDPVAGTLEPRPSAQRIAVTTGGTIPDRGMFGVFLAGEEAGRRVGELDEEMVYESRVGDVFTLGASSWRILEINRDQVIVAPAAGHTGRLPFWTGDAEGRPVELGIAIGEYRRHATTYDFIDSNTAANLASFYRDQRETAGIIPDEKTLLLERFQDDLGDWRVVIHSPFGRGVNAPWAMALAAEIQRETGVDSMAVAGDDGLILRLPHTDAPPTLANAHVADVMDNVGASALFAGRFRECAARALLLPRRNPGKRQPLWQQRQRAAQLLDVAREHSEFPIMVEAMRECLHDVYNMDAFREVLDKLGSSIRVVEVTTTAPSAFAESLLFSYSGAFMYEGDSTRSTAMAVDPVLLAKVLGTSEQGVELDPDVVQRVVAAAQWLAEGRRATSMEQVVDMLRSLGPMTREQIARRSEVELDESFIPRRLAEVHYGGSTKIAVVEDMALLRDGLGVPVPPGVAADTTLHKDALEQLLYRWMRHRGPTESAEAAREFGIGAAIAEALLSRRMESIGTAFIDTAMLRRLRSATLAAARGAVEPVSQRAYAQFLLRWHAIQDNPDLFNVIEQLAGVYLPRDAWETQILPARIPDYDPTQLDELMRSGEVIAVGSGSMISLMPAELAPQPAAPLSPNAEQLYERMSGGGAFLAHELDLNDPAPLWELFEAGRITPDSFVPLRAAKPVVRRRRIRNVVPGRWALIRWNKEITAAEQAALQGESWIERYGVVTRGSIMAEKAQGGFAEAYRLFKVWEDTGSVVRGYIVDGLGGAQFAPREVLGQLREEESDATVVLAAMDPANPYGAALAWPESGGTPARKDGAQVILKGGELLAYISRGKMLMFGDDVEAVVREWSGVIERINGVSVMELNLQRWKAAGARLVPKGLSIR